MLLYNRSIEIDVPESYRDISAQMVAQDYQYVLAREGDSENFMFIDLMRPHPDVDLHIEDIIQMNEIDMPTILEMSYTSQGFKKGIYMFLMKYKSQIKPKLEKREEGGLEWMFSQMEGEMTRNDGDTRRMFIVVGVAKYLACDVVISIFKEDMFTEREIDHARKMVREVKVLNNDLFIEEQDSGL